MKIYVCDICGQEIDKTLRSRILSCKKYYKMKVIWDTGEKETIEFCSDCMNNFKEYVSTNMTQ